MTLGKDGQLMQNFKRQAIKLGMCKEWRRTWERTSLIDKYLNAISWCMKREFPSLADMEKYDSKLLAHSVYNEKDVDIYCENDMYVFNSSKVNFTIDGYKVCRIYAGRNSNITVNIKDHAFLIIDNYGSKININKEENAKYQIWNHETIN